MQGHNNPVYQVPNSDPVLVPAEFDAVGLELDAAAQGPGLEAAGQALELDAIEQDPLANIQGQIIPQAPQAHHQSGSGQDAAEEESLANVGPAQLIMPGYGVWSEQPAEVQFDPNAGDIPHAIPFAPVGPDYVYPVFDGDFPIGHAQMPPEDPALNSNQENHEPAPQPASNFHAWFQPAAAQQQHPQVEYKQEQNPDEHKNGPGLS